MAPAHSNTPPPGHSSPPPHHPAPRNAQPSFPSRNRTKGIFFQKITDAQNRGRENALRGSPLAARQRGSLGSEPPASHQRTLLRQTSTVSTFRNRPVTSVSPATFVLSGVRGSLAEPTLATSPVLSCRTCPRRRVCPTHKIMRQHIDIDIDIDNPLPSNAPGARQTGCHTSAPSPRRSSSHRCQPCHSTVRRRSSDKVPSPSSLLPPPLRAPTLAPVGAYAPT